MVARAMYPITIVPASFGNAPAHLLSFGHGRPYLTGDLHSTLSLVESYPAWIGTSKAPPQLREGCLDIPLASSMVGA